MNRGGVMLLVEDNRDDVELALRAFDKAREIRDIVVARDGAEAVELLLGPGPSHGALAPDVVLLDLKLPKIDGFGVLRRLRSDERTRRLPVVVMTSSDEERDVAQSYDLGANSFIRKPVDFAQFVEAARQVGLYWLGLNRPPTVD